MRGKAISGRVPLLRQTSCAPPVAASSQVDSALSSRVGELMVSGNDTTWNAWVTQTFVVPPGVRRVSILGITAGTSAYSDGTNSYHGYPGAVAYANNVPVTPGDVLTIEVTGIASSMDGQCFCRVMNNRKDFVLFGIERNTYSYDYTHQYNRRALTYGHPPPGYLDRAPTAGAPSAGSGGAYDTGGLCPYGHGPDGVASTPNGSQLDSSWKVFGAFGISGGGLRPQMAGCVRIIWGPGRSFPLNARPITK